MTAAPLGKLPGLRKRANMSKEASADIALVASSKSRTCGCLSRTRAMANRCCSPPESNKAQLASSFKARPSRQFKSTAFRALFTSSSEKSLEPEGYVTACFSVPWGM
mmetsp:Transcript_79097/g.124797  ORF Transcript_79097/g.124797 Transcript_79097/m.124797 type:complete len:107 (+) Transcript_79097:157-477(+)